jgi:hypothetical protein
MDVSASQRHSSPAANRVADEQLVSLKKVLYSQDSFTGMRSFSQCDLACDTGQEPTADGRCQQTRAKASEEVADRSLGHFVSLIEKDDIRMTLPCGVAMFLVIQTSASRLVSQK